MVEAKIKFLLFGAVLLLAVSAQAQSWSRIPVVQPDTSQPLSAIAAKEAALLDQCKPALDSLYAVVGFCPSGIIGYRPFSPLGNFVSDALLSQMRRLTGEQCQLAVVNYGGVRVDMPKGDIRLDDIRSMFPFHDTLCVVKTRGANILAMFNKMAGDKWEFFSGAKVVADSSRVLSVSVAGEPLDTNRLYSLVCGDFLLDGGDDFYLARGAQSVTRTPYNMFTVMLFCLEEMKSRNVQIASTVDDRLSLVNVRSTSGPVHTPDTPSAGSSRKARLTILHTNDTHSHLEPLRAGPFIGMAGVMARAAMIDSVRRENGKRNVLLLDAGDYCQGTSYFPVFGGEAEVRAMNIMGYDVATTGNHEWDNGSMALEYNLRRASFKTVLCNYTVDDPFLAKHLSPYVIVRRGGMKIGIIGALTDIKSKVKGGGDPGIHYTNPVGPVNEWAAFLKEKKHCDLVILLSHCGYDEGTQDNPSDSDMAPQLRNVDIIIGGHTHTDMKEPAIFHDADGRDLIVVTDFKWGVYLGEIKID